MSISFNPNEIEFLSQQPYSKLIEKKAEEGLSYVLEVTKDSEMDGVSLYKSLKDQKVEEVFFTLYPKGKKNLLI